MPEDATKSIVGNLTMYRSSVFNNQKLIDSEFMFPPRTSTKVYKKYNNNSISLDKACCAKGGKCY